MASTRGYWRAEYVLDDGKGAREFVQRDIDTLTGWAMPEGVALADGATVFVDGREYQWVLDEWYG